MIVCTQFARKHISSQPTCFIPKYVGKHDLFVFSTISETLKC